MGKIENKDDIKESLRGPDGYLYLVRPKKPELGRALNELILESRLQIMGENQNPGVQAWYAVDLHTLLAITQSFSRGIDYELRREGPDGQSRPWKPSFRELANLQKREQQR